MRNEREEITAEELIHTERKENAVIIKILIEEVVMYTAPDLREAVINAISERPAFVIIDFSAVKRLDSTGLAIIFRVNKLLNEYNGTLRLVGLNKSLLKVLHNVAGYDDSAYFETTEEATRDLM